MEKISIKPDVREILMNGPSDKSLSEVFSYDYSNAKNQDSISIGEPIKKLGSLFLIGHIQPNTDDTSYILSLISSLAKREYYLNSNSTPKESFSRTLKKVNEALDDFFENKDTKINLGIFAIAGENILISKLGKFKIMLARDEQNIDILNNINLFDKERTKEKEFSSIISGKIISGDKIFAYYPNRTITSREKSLKDYFIRHDSKKFVQRLDGIKKEKDSFVCAAIHLTINEHKESAIIDSPQPAELKVAPIKKYRLTDGPHATLAGSETSSKSDLPDKIQRGEDDEPNYNKENATIKVNVFNDRDNIVKQEDGLNKTPLIIPSEFSSAKKSNLLSSIVNGFRSIISQIINIGKSNNKKKVASFLFILIMVALVFGITNLPIFNNPIEKRIDATLKSSLDNTKLAKTKINQNNFADARKLLMGAILEISNIDPDENLNKAEESKEIKDELFKLLDGIDNAIETSPVLVDSFPSALSETIFNTIEGRKNIKDNKYNLDSPAFDLGAYRDNLYILTANNIFKIDDASKGETGIKSWLSEDEKLPSEPALIAVDGNVYVLDSSGILNTFYKGKKDKTYNTFIAPSHDNSLLLTTQDSVKLYLIDKKLGRIYLIAKESGLLIRTLKTGSIEPIVDAHLDDNETIYFVTKDERMWKIEQEVGI